MDHGIGVDKFSVLYEYEFSDLKLLERVWIVRFCILLWNDTIK